MRSNLRRKAERLAKRGRRGAVPVGELAAKPAVCAAIPARPSPVQDPPPPVLEPPAANTEPQRGTRRLRRQPVNPADYERYAPVRNLIAGRYRSIFAAARPLAIGIDKPLREAFTEEELPTDDLKVFLRVWVRRKAYRAALERGDRRVNLDGSDAGPAFGDTQAGEAAGVSPPAAVEGDEQT
jgi:hypothetical protein